jgi:UDP-GlcNAc:undecaprenyl-phosphate GlcNAc-1-phosphate transferase
MHSLWVIWVAMLGCAATWLSVPFIRRFLPPTVRRQLHQTHQQPVSRFGGLALIVPFLAASAAVFEFFPGDAGRIEEQWLILISALSMFLLGFWDDLSPLGARRKLVGQILIASTVYILGAHGESHLSITSFRSPFTGIDYPLGTWSYLATVLWLVAFTNLINLIDGVDGLASGICLIVMGLMLFVGWQSHQVFTITCAACLSGGLVGFLCYNFPPATIYLGDGGAYFLGFLIGITSMLNSHKGTVVGALIAPLFALALPILDVILAIVRRSLKGVPIFRPDQRHLHHRLAQAGLSRTRVVLMFYGCSLFFLLLALGVFLSKGRWLPVLFGILCLVLLASARVFSFSRKWFAVRNVLENSLEIRKKNRYALALGRWLELEAERSGSPEALWEDFSFISKKLGFSAVVLHTPETNKRWLNSLVQDRDVPIYYRSFDLPSGFKMEFTARSNHLESSPFEFLSELAAEIWVRSSDRWIKVNRIAFRFRAGTSDAPEPIHTLPLQPDRGRLSKPPAALANGLPHRAGLLSSAIVAALTLPCQGQEVLPPPTAIPPELLEQEPTTGLRLSRFDLYPRISALALYDDNLFSSSTVKKTDLIWNVSPGASVRLGEVSPEEKSLTLDYSPSYIFYTDQTEYDTVDHAARLSGVWPFSKVTLGISQDFTQTSSVVPGVADIVEQRALNTQLTSRYELSEKTSFEFNGRQTLTDYADPRLINSAERANDDWFNYQLLPKLNAGAGLTIGQLQPDHSPSQAYQRVSLRGVFRATGKLDLNASLGVERRTYATRDSADYEPGFALGASYQATATLTVNANGFRQEQNSAYLEGQNYVSTGFSWGVQQSLFEPFSLTLAGSYYNLSYHSAYGGWAATQSENVLSVRPAVDWVIRRNLRAGVFYSYRHNNSNQSNLKYTDSQVGIQASWFY